MLMGIFQGIGKTDCLITEIMIEVTVGRGKEVISVTTGQDFTTKGKVLRDTKKKEIQIGTK